MLFPAPESNAQFQFGTPTLLPETVNSVSSNVYDFEPSISSDGLELYFTSTRSGWATWVSRRDSVEDEFGPAEFVVAMNHPSISHDGLTLYGTRDGGFGGEDLYMITRADKDANWNLRTTNLGANVNTALSDRFGDISADGRELYFSRSIVWDSPDAELFVATRNDPTDPLGFGPAEDLGPQLNDPDAWDSEPNISSNGLWLFYSSNREGGFGEQDIWVCMRPSVGAPWGEPVNLGEAINTSEWEGGPSISADNKTMYFYRQPTAGWEPEEIWQIPILSTPAAEPGDVNHDGLLDAADIDAISLAIRQGRSEIEHDVNLDNVVNRDDHAFWVHELRRTWFGDADLNGLFDSVDFVHVFQGGKYEMQEYASWAEGDWNGDGLFDSADFVIAFQDGGYEQGLRTDVAAVPEPGGLLLLFLGLVGVMRRRRAAQDRR